MPKPKKFISQQEIYNLAESKGWRSKASTDVEDIPELLCLLHSEISEALEAYRGHATPFKGPGNIGEELADLVIRVRHFCALYDIDLEAEIVKKHEFNKTRPFRHGMKRC